MCIPAGGDGVTGVEAGVAAGLAVGGGVGVGVLLTPVSCNPGGVFALGLPGDGVAAGGVPGPA